MIFAACHVFRLYPTEFQVFGQMFRNVQVERRDHAHVLNRTRGNSVCASCVVSEVLLGRCGIDRVDDRVVCWETRGGDLTGLTLGVVWYHFCGNQSDFFECGVFEIMFLVKTFS